MKKAFIPVFVITMLAGAGALADEETLSENGPAEDVTVEFNWDDDKLFLDVAAGETRVKFDSGAGEYEVYLPKDPASEDAFFRENDLYVSIDEAADRITVRAKGDKEKIRETLDELVEGDLGELEDEEVEGIVITELDDGYEIVVEGKNGSAGDDEEDDD